MRELEFHRKKIGRSKGIKLRTIKMIKKSRLNNELNYKEKNLIKGSVWGIADSSVSFDKKRNAEKIKEADRPCLILKTPQLFETYSKVLIAPGTTQISNFDLQHSFVIKVNVPPEALKRTTYFKLSFLEFVPQIVLTKKYCDLSSKLIDEIDNFIL